MTTLPPPMPLVLLETMLHQAPLDVLLFDTDLICRYAAPADGSLFGQRAHELVGQSARDLFAPENGDLHVALELAAQTAASYSYPTYRYTHARATEQTHYCWSVRIEPVLLRDYRGLDEFRGVLVTLADVQDLADTSDRLAAERDDVRREADNLRWEVARLREELAETRMRRDRRVREVLTPAKGYLQLLSRRPDVLGDRSAESVIESVVLPGIQRAVDAVTRADDSTRTDEPGNRS